MAEEVPEEVNSPQPPSVLEVVCQSSGKKSRFAAGTKAGFAVSLMNRKLDNGAPLALHIEAVKKGEEPISFGPDAVLVNYGNGWKLQTVCKVDFPEKVNSRQPPSKRTEIPEVRDAAREAAPREIKERIKKTKDEKKAKKAEVAAKQQKTLGKGNNPKGSVQKGSKLGGGGGKS